MILYYPFSLTNRMFYQRFRLKRKRIIVTKIVDKVFFINLGSNKHENSYKCIKF